MTPLFALVQRSSLLRRAPIWGQRASHMLGIHGACGSSHRPDRVRVEVPESLEADDGRAQDLKDIVGRLEGDMRTLLESLRTTPCRQVGSEHSGAGGERSMLRVVDGGAGGIRERGPPGERKRRG